MDKIYTVKQAALILEFSTNTIYKYLEDGTLESARGAGRQSRFRIPHSALESYLGSPLSEDHVLEKLDPEAYTHQQSLSSPTQELTTKNQELSGFPLLLARILIIASLIAIILDVVFSHSFNLTTQLLRMAMIAIFVLLAYQFGGYKEK